MQLIARSILFFLFILSSYCSLAQEELPMPVRIDGIKGRGQFTQPSMNPSAMNPPTESQTSGTDSLGFTRRDDSKEAVTVTWRYLDSVKRHNLDSSVNDFDTYFPVPSRFNYLGNTGAAA